MTDEELRAAHRRAREEPYDLLARANYIANLKRADKTIEVFNEIAHNAYLDLRELIAMHARKLNPFPSYPSYIGPMDVLYARGIHLNPSEYIRSEPRPFVLLPDGRILKGKDMYHSIDIRDETPVEDAFYVSLAEKAINQIDNHLRRRELDRCVVNEPYDPYDHGDAFHC